MEYEKLTEFQKNHLSHLFSPENPMAIAKMLPPIFCGHLLENVLKADPEVLELISDEDELLRHLKAEKHYRPTVNDQRLRYLFWQEYENAVLDNRKMIVSNVHSLVCDIKSFQKLFVGSLPYRTAFLLCRPAAYQHTLHEMLLHGMKRMRQILDLPETDANGKINTKIIELKLKVTAMVDMRVNGAPTQKVHQITQNLTSGISATKSDVKELVNSGDMATIQKRIEEIESEKRKLESRTISVEPVKKAVVDRDK